MDEKYGAMVKAMLDSVAQAGQADQALGSEALACAAAAMVEGLAKLAVLSPPGFLDVLVAELREQGEIARVEFDALLAARGVARPTSQVH